MPNWKKLIVSGSDAALNSLNVTTNVIASSFTGSFSGTSSYASQALTSSFASTASSADNFTIRGILTAQTINVQTITSSIEFNTGSTRNGSNTSNTHEFTGSVSITGSLQVNGSNIILTNQTSSMSVATASYVLQAISSSFATNALTASYASNVPLTASYALNALSASYAANVPLTSSYALNSNTASYALTASYVLGASAGSSYASLIQSSSSTTWVFTHNLGYLYPVITVYDVNNNQIIPSQISASTVNQLIISFTSARTGYATAVIGSATPTPSTINVYTAIGANTLVGTVTGSYNSAFFNYSAASASNARAGQITTIWNGSSIVFSETTTNDIGNTSGVTFTASLSGNTIAVTAGTTSANWNIKLTSAYL